MSVYRYYQCGVCKAVYRGPAQKPARCPRCATNTPPKVFKGEPANHLPPCSDGLRLRP